jgi:hypothetical protein
MLSVSERNRNDARRLNELLSHFNIRPTDLAKLMGWSRAQRLFDIQKEKCGISKAIANEVCAVLPSVRLSWLLIGDGKMILERPGLGEKAVQNPSNEQLLEQVKKLTQVNAALMAELHEISAKYIKILEKDR